MHLSSLPFSILLVAFFHQIREMEQVGEVSPSPRPEPKLDKKKAEKAERTASAASKKDSSLHMVDLDDPPLSPVPESQSSMDE